MIHWEKWCDFVLRVLHLGVSENNGTPKSSILIGFSITNHPFWGTVPIFGNTHFEFDPKCFPSSGCNSKVWVVSDVKIPTTVDWWFRNSVQSPVEVGSLSHYLYGFYIPGGCLTIKSIMSTGILASAFPGVVSAGFWRENSVQSEAFECPWTETHG